jgi:hypothetical protein
VQEFVGGYEDWIRQSTSEVRGQKSGVRSQKSEERNQKSDVRSQKSEVRSQNADAGEEQSGARNARPPKSGAKVSQGRAKASVRSSEASDGGAKASAERPAPKKLTHKEQRELEVLPARIEALESEQRALNAKIAGSDFYKEPPDIIKASLARVEELQHELTDVYARWGQLDSRR